MIARIFIAAVLAAMILTLAGCPQVLDNGDGNGNGADDTTPPTFAGLATITAEKLSRAVLEWLAATDETTAQGALVYDIWKASVQDVPTSVAPAFTTAPGATEFTVTGLPGGVTTYFLVRARDGAGNRDANTTARGVMPDSVAWAFVDGGAATGIDDGFAVYSTTAAVVGNELYAMWTESDESPVLARSAVYNGNDSSPTWTDVDGGANVGMNFDNGYSVLSYSALVGMRMVSFDGRLYATWAEDNDSEHVTRVAVYSPSLLSWSFVDGGLYTGLNHDSFESAREPTLVVNGTTLFALWLEDNGFGLYQVRAATYNGNDVSPAWTFVDGDEANGLNFVVSDNALQLSAASSGGRLVAAWVEAGLLRAKSYDGSSWSAADQGALNFDVTQTAYDTSLAASGGKLYLAWREFDSVSTTDLIRARVFGGSFASPSWAPVDGNGHTGLNFDAGQHAMAPRLADMNPGLVIVFVESNGFANQIRARVFNGDTANPAWQTIDGGGANGLNYDPGYAASQPYPVAFGGKLYITFAESSGVSATETRVIRGM